jgi:hypothetical protein
VIVTQRRIVLSFVALVAAVAAAPAQEADLTWKFKKGDTFYQEMTTSTDQTMKVQGTEVVQNQKQTFYFQWTVKDVDDKKKEVTLEQKIIGLKMSIDIGGSKINYDSTAKDTGATTNPLNKFFEALNNATFKLTLNTEKMEVTDIEGEKDFVTKLNEANPQMKPLLDKILSKKALQDMAQPMFAAIPGGKKAKGKEWDKTSDLDMGPIGSYKTKYTYTYEGPDKDKNEVIKVKTDLKYEAPKDATGGLPFRIKQADLKSTDGTGEIIFDPKSGRLASSKLNLTLSGSLTIEIGGQPTVVELNQKQTTEIKTTDKSPIEKK